MPDSTDDTELLADAHFAFEIEEESDDQDEGSGAPAPREREPSGEEQPAESDEGGQPRGPDGKFVKREPAEVPSADTPPEGAPAAAPPDAAAPSPPLETPPATAAEPTPFAFRAYGQQFPLEHAVLDAEGRLVVAREGLPRVQQMLARGVEAERLRAQVQSLQAQADARAKTYDALDQLFSSVDRSDPESVEAFAASMVEFLDRFPALQKEAEISALRAELEATRHQAAPPVDPVALAPENARSLLAESAPFTSELGKVGERERGEIAARIESRAASFVRVATEDDAIQWGVAVGQPIFDADLLYAEVQYEVGLRVKAAEAARVAQAAAQKNRRTTQETVAGPPSVSGGSAEAVGGKGGPRVFASREEYDEAMES